MHKCINIQQLARDIRNEIKIHGKLYEDLSNDVLKIKSYEFLITMQRMIIIFFLGKTLTLRSNAILIIRNKARKTRRAN